MTTSFADLPTLRLEQITKAIKDFHDASSPGAMFPVVLAENRYGFLFEDLQADPANLLRPDPTTAANLIRLGELMVDNPSNPKLDSEIPSAYTYLGQVIDHDLTRQSFGAIPTVNERSMPFVPLRRNEIDALSNVRTVGLDLDCVYGPAIESGTSYNIPRDPVNKEKLKIERTAKAPSKPELPREKDSPHFALIGDRRNDENLMVSQLHLAFMLAHNKLVDQGETFERARQILRRHYQWIVVNDYLPRVCDHKILKAVLDGKLNLFDPPEDDTRLPLEFSVAAFRFGHSMTRDVYNYNGTFERTPLFQLLLPGFLNQYHHIPTEWTIDWKRFFDGRNLARRIDTRLAQGLRRLSNGSGRAMPLSLASIDLLKGFLLRVPTGEAVAKRLGIAPLTPKEIYKLIGKDQAQAIVDGQFEKRTPLWFYILVEAQASPDGRLGKVGSSIVASVMIGLARQSRDSYLRIPGFEPTLGGKARFQLKDLIKFAGV